MSRDYSPPIRDQYSPGQSCQVPVGVDRPPPHAGLVHVLAVGKPDVHSICVIKLTAEGDLALVEVVSLTHLDAVKQVSHSVEELLRRVLRLSKCTARVSDEGTLLRGS